MSDDIRERLGARFPRTVERTKPGKGAAIYVSAAHYIDRLNTVLGIGGWAWQRTWQRLDGEVIVEGELVIGGISYPGIDVHELATVRDTDVLVKDALANAIKGAESGAMVRSCRLLGIGLYLWADGGKDELGSETEAAASTPASKKQIDAITMIAKCLAWGDAQLSVWLADRDCDPESLSSMQAGEAVTDLHRLAATEKERLIEELRRAIREERTTAADISKVIGPPQKASTEALRAEVARLNRGDA